MTRRMATAVLAATLACAHHDRGPAAAIPELRLPRDVRPLRYALELAIAPEHEGFRGVVAIEVELRRPAPVVWLHARDLTVSDAWVDVAGRRVEAAFAQVTPEGVARLTPAAVLPAGTATLHLAFAGAWNEHLVGLYRVRAAGKSYVYSQFEPIEARRAFP